MLPQIYIDTIEAEDRLYEMFCDAYRTAKNYIDLIRYADLARKFKERRAVMANDFFRLEIASLKYEKKGLDDLTG